MTAPVNPLVAQTRHEVTPDQRGEVERTTWRWLAMDRERVAIRRQLQRAEAEYRRASPFVAGAAIAVRRHIVQDSRLNFPRCRQAAVRCQ